MPEPILPTAANASAERLFFVYGTLRKGDDNDITRLQPAPRYVGTARIQGVMFHLGGYPGVTLGGDKDIVGEVYAVAPQLEAKLDAIESEYPAQPDEYAKRAIAVRLDGTTLDCFVYEINPRFAVGKPVIASGDWVKDR
ncbi:MAG: gamma-glutamylcyclotransferase family protein [Burkholderiaceae bacterium]